MIQKFKYYGIEFPFRYGSNGFYFNLTTTEISEVKSNLLHLLLTKKGERLKKPKFGTNLMDFIFDQFDQQTFNNIKNELYETVQQNLKGVKIDNIILTPIPETVTLDVLISFTFDNGAFLQQDNLNFNISNGI